MMSEKNTPIEASSMFDDVRGTNFAADPVNELTSSWIVSEADLTDAFSKVTQEQLDEDRAERVLHGVSRRNIWNFCNHWAFLVAMNARGLMDVAKDEEYRDFYEELVQGVIAFNEYAMGAANTMAFFSNNDAYRTELERWKKEWQPKSDAFRVTIVDNWSKLPAEGPGWSQDEVDSIAKAFEGEFSYDEAIDLIPDPVAAYVPDESLEEHQEQRRMRGYSDWDTKNFRLFIIWVTAQATVFLTSGNAAGYPHNEDAGIDSFESYVKVQRECILEVLRGELRFSVSGTADAPYMTAVARMLELVPGMWD